MLHADDPANDLVIHAGAGVPLGMDAGGVLTIRYRSPRDGRDLLIMLAVVEPIPNTIAGLDD